MKNILIKYHKNLTILLLILIVALGCSLRFVDYNSIPPFSETADEFFYPWAGMSMIQTGVPTSWSWFNYYQNAQIIEKWGGPFRLVSPWLEKPPLFPLVQGAWALMMGEHSFFEVKTTTIRFIPVIFGSISILLIFLLSKRVFSSQIGIIAALLYAVNPTIIISNRFSLSENLLTPLVLITLLIYLSDIKNVFFKAVLVGIFSGLAILTKQIGIVLPVVLFGLAVYQKQYKTGVVLLLIAGLLGAIYPLLGFFYGWNLFMSVQKEFSQSFVNSGLPEFIQTIFLYPSVGRKDKFIYDGSVLLGYILLFSSFWWLQIKDKTALEKQKLYALLSFPFGFLILQSFLASGADFSFYGWHVFPLFPFLMILLANILVNVWNDFNLGKILVILLILGSSTVRFALLFFPKNIQNLWQYPLGIIFFLGFLSWLMPGKKIRKVILLSLFLIYICVNIYTVINLKLIYPSMPQPLN